MPIGLRDWEREAIRELIEMHEPIRRALRKKKEEESKRGSSNE